MIVRVGYGHCRLAGWYLCDMMRGYGKLGDLCVYWLVNFDYLCTADSYDLYRSSILSIIYGMV